VGASLFVASLLARRRGGDGRLLALAGGTALGAGGYLGGHLSFAEGIGVDQTVFEAEPEDWTAVLDAGELPENEPRCAVAAGTPVLLVRSGGTVRALSNHCAHRGAPLHEGELGDGTITCPWHGSEFALDDGALVRGPAAYPQPAWDAREADGKIEVRPRS
jgi:nitrite reductase/ring-hydroxylating ferredoxin subunit